MMGVLIHVMGDALNNIGVIIASTVIWKAKYEGRYYADPAVSMGIAIMILLSSIPLGKFPPLPPIIPTSNHRLLPKLASTHTA
jgi:Co/Zn/Cd efflux system component